MHREDRDMSNLKINVLEKLNYIYYKGEILTNEEIEKFFNRRKRSMSFDVDSQYIDKIEQRNYGYIEIYYKNGETKSISGKILSYEKAKYEDEFYLGINVSNEKELDKSHLLRTELAESLLFLKRVESMEAVYPDLSVLLTDNSKIVKIPFYNLDDELVFEQIMTREKALGVEKDNLIKTC
jgi:hypothetical protein